MADRSLAAALACQMTLAAAALAAAGAPNLVPNGDLEAPSPTNPALPAAWSPHVSGKVTAAWVPQEGRSGTHGLRMTTDPAEKRGHAFWTSARFPITPCIAYRVRFHFKATGFGVPCFSLAKIKDWRLFKGGTEGSWIAHEDVVVVPPGVTSTFFSVNNYHRAGKTMWLDDVSVVELPLAESPLAKRLAKAQHAAVALEKSLAPLLLSLEQEEEVDVLRKGLADATAAYAKLQAGQAAAADFQAMSRSLDAVEKAIGAYLFTVWAVAPDAWERGRAAPAAATRELEAELEAAPGAAAHLLVGIASLVGEGLPCRFVLEGDKKAKGWRAHVAVAPAHRRPGQALAWGAVNSLGEVYLPPDRPRFLRLEIEPDPKTRPGAYTFGLRLEALDRTTEQGRIAIRVVVR